MVTTWEHTERPAPPTSRRQGFRKTPNGTGVHMHTAVCSPEQGLGDWLCRGRGRRGSIRGTTAQVWPCEGHICSSHPAAPGLQTHCFMFPRPALGRTCYDCGSLRPQRVQDTRLCKERTQGADLARQAARAEFKHEPHPSWPTVHAHQFQLILLCKQNFSWRNCLVC